MFREPGGGAVSPESVRREFARHLEQYLVRPSGRYAGLKWRQARGELAGRLVYEPSAGVRWCIRAGQNGTTGLRTTDYGTA